MSRICGVCFRPPREGEEMRPIRIKEEDLEHCKAKEVGLYSACLDCVGEHRKRYAERHELSVNDVSNHMMC